MWMVVGLGNPGVEYEASRHNVGFMAVEELAGRAGIALTARRHRSLFARGILCGTEVLFVKPLTFMNDSGSAVLRWQRALGLGPASMIVIHDDLDLPTSQLRIKAGGGHGGHKGIRSILEALGSGDFLRVKVGIGRPHPGRGPVAHVLGTFEKSERGQIEEAVKRTADAVELVLREGVRAAMNRYNVRQARKQGRTDQGEGGEQREHL